jgi:hypothetical protein
VFYRECRCNDPDHCTDGQEPSDFGLVVQPQKPGSHILCGHDNTGLWLANKTKDLRTQRHQSHCVSWHLGIQPIAELKDRDKSHNRCLQLGRSGCNTSPSNREHQHMWAKNPYQSRAANGCHLFLAGHIVRYQHGKFGPDIYGQRIRHLLFEGQEQLHGHMVHQLQFCFCNGKPFSGTATCTYGEHQHLWRQSTDKGHPSKWGHLLLARDIMWNQYGQLFPYL